MITGKSLIVVLAVASTALYQCTLDHKNTDDSGKNQSDTHNSITGIQLDSLEGVWWSKDEHRHALFYIVDDHCTTPRINALPTL